MAHVLGLQRTQSIPPYLHRYYPSTGNYVGVAVGMIYILGVISGGAVLARESARRHLVWEVR